MNDVDRRGHIATLVLSGLLALLYVGAGVPKVVGVESAVTGFQSMGYPAWFRVVIGVIEIGGGVALLIPRLAFYGAGALGVVMIGAAYTLVVHGEPGIAIPIVCLLLLATLAYLRRPTR